MQVEIVKGPGSAAAKLQLGQGETCTAEAGAMIAMSGHLSLTTTTHKKKSGGILKAAKRLLAGESFFLNHYSADRGAGEVWLAPTMMGDMTTYGEF